MTATARLSADTVEKQVMAETTDPGALPYSIDAISVRPLQVHAAPVVVTATSQQCADKQLKGNRLLLLPELLTILPPMRRTKQELSTHSHLHLRSCVQSQRFITRRR